MPFILPELPYDKSAFGDLISAETFIIIMENITKLMSIKPTLW
jgi:hypothetical protein